MCELKAAKLLTGHQETLPGAAASHQMGFSREPCRGDFCELPLRPLGRANARPSAACIRHGGVGRPGTTSPLAHRPSTSRRVWPEPGPKAAVHSLSCSIQALPGAQPATSRNGIQRVEPSSGGSLNRRPSLLHAAGMRPFPDHHLARGQGSSWFPKTSAPRAR